MVGVGDESWNGTGLVLDFSCYMGISIDIV